MAFILNKYKLVKNLSCKFVKIKTFLSIYFTGLKYVNFSKIKFKNNFLLIN